MVKQRIKLFTKRIKQKWQTKTDKQINKWGKTK